MKTALLFLIPLFFVTPKPQTAPQESLTSDAIAQRCQAAAFYVLESSSVPSMYAADYSYCIGYVEGVEATYVYTKLSRDEKQDICLPMSSKTYQYGRVVARYGDNHPEALHLPAPVFVIRALKEAYPCK